jgi:hypothetical protein
MTIGRKLEIGVASVLALTVAVGIAWLGSLGSLGMDRQSAAERTAQRLQIAAEMDSAGSNMLAAMRGMVLFTAAGERSQAALCRQEFDSAAGSWRKSIGDIRPLLTQDDQRRTVDRMQDRLTAWRAAIAEVERAAARGDSDAALRIASAKGYPIYRANAGDTARFRQVQDGILDAQQASAAAVSRAGWWTDFGALGLAAGAGLLTLFFVNQTSRIAQSTWERAASPAEAAAPPVEAEAIVKSVDETAFQMSLLSLNTTLEAAASRPPVATEEAGNLVRRSAPPTVE